MSVQLSEAIQERTTRLGTLLANTQLPAPMITAIEKKLPDMTYLEMEMVTAALENEDAQLERLDQVFLAAEEKAKQRKQEIEGRVQDRLGAIVDQVVANETEAAIAQARIDLAAA